MPPYFELIARYFPELSPSQLDQYEAMWDFYHDWNSRINVISRKDIDELYLRHVLHSLAIARVAKLTPGAKVLDIGTGGGFPGIPLSIYFPEVDFLLIDSIGKKVKVVNEAVKYLKIHNAHCEQARAESVNDRFHLVVSRAVTRLPVFLSWILNNILPPSADGCSGGIMYLKGGDMTDELSTIKAWHYAIHEISDDFSEPFFQTKKVVHLYR